MKINRSIMFSTKWGKGPQKEITKLISKFSDNHSLELTMLLIYHRNIENSFFKPYLDTLPSFFSVPIYWDLNIFESFGKSVTVKRAIGILKSRYN